MRPDKRSTPRPIRYQAGQFIPKPEPTEQPDLNYGFTCDLCGCHQPVQLHNAVDQPDGRICPACQHLENTPLTDLQREEKKLWSALQSGEITLEDINRFRENNRVQDQPVEALLPTIGDLDDQDESSRRIRAILHRPSPQEAAAPEIIDPMTLPIETTTSPVVEPVMADPPPEESVSLEDRLTTRPADASNAAPMVPGIPQLPAQDFNAGGSPTLEDRLPPATGTLEPKFSGLPYPGDPYQMNPYPGAPGLPNPADPYAALAEPWEQLAYQPMVPRPEDSQFGYFPPVQPPYYQAHFDLPEYPFHP